MMIRTRGVSILVMIEVSVAREDSVIVSLHVSVTLYSDSGSDWL